MRKKPTRPAAPPAPVSAPLPVSAPFPATAEDLAAACRAWNDRHPIGTAVAVRMPYGRDAHGYTTTVAHVAGNAAAVWIDNITGAQPLAHVRPLDAGERDALAAARRQVPVPRSRRDLLIAEWNLAGRDAAEIDAALTVAMADDMARAAEGSGDARATDADLARAGWHAADIAALGVRAAAHLRARPRGRALAALADAGAAA